MKERAIKRLSKTLKFTKHARDEMLYEESGEIYEQEVKEALRRGKIIEEYPHDKPYPSYLVFGQTGQGRPLHIVCAPAEEEGLLVIITVYEPDPGLWVDFTQRRGR